MSPSNEQQKWIRIAGALGCVQGLTWAILSLICIVVYDKHPSSLFEKIPTVNEYSTLLQFLMYFFHFDSSANSEEEKAHYGLMLSNAFYSFAWMYFIESVAWVASSLLIVFRQQHRLFPKYLRGWWIITFFVCVIDLLFVLIVGINYGRCLGIHEEFQGGITELQCAIGILPVLAIGAKGFTLWIINLIFGVILLKIQKVIGSP